MGNFGPPILALGIGGLITGLDILTSRYARQYFLLWRRSKALYVYCLIYGGIAAAVTGAYPALKHEHVFSITGLGFDNAWLRAVYVGLSTKALLHIRIASTHTESPRPLPIGVETVVQIFEPALIRAMDIKADHEVRVYLQARVEKYTNLTQVKTKIIDNIPESLPDEERGAFEMDIRKRKKPYDCMAGCLKFLGKDSFERIFPL